MGNPSVAAAAMDLSQGTTFNLNNLMDSRQLIDYYNTTTNSLYNSTSHQMNPAQLPQITVFFFLFILNLKFIFQNSSILSDYSSYQNSLYRFKFN